MCRRKRRYRPLPDLVIGPAVPVRPVPILLLQRLSRPILTPVYVGSPPLPHSERATASRSHPIGFNAAVVNAILVTDHSLISNRVTLPLPSKHTIRIGGRKKKGPGRSEARLRRWNQPTIRSRWTGSTIANASERHRPADDFGRLNPNRTPCIACTSTIRGARPWRATWAATNEWTAARRS